MAGEYTVFYMPWKKPDKVEADTPEDAESNAPGVDDVYSVHLIIDNNNQRWVINTDNEWVEDTPPEPYDPNGKCSHCGKVGKDRGCFNSPHDCLSNY